MLMFRLQAHFPETVRLLRGLPVSLKAPALAARPASQPRPVKPERAPMDRETARALVDAGYMPLQRYVELFDERIVEPPYNRGNFGEGEV